MASKSRYLKGRAVVSELIAKNARIVELVDDLIFRHLMQVDYEELADFLRKNFSFLMLRSG